MRARSDTLTEREKQVLKLIAEGRRNRDIAEYLFVSVKTVEKHRANLMSKLDLHNTAALTSFAIANTLITG
jgi:DNA-binding NarL/FixJ family response regulator